MGHFDGQVVLVTGAGGGIGRAHALLLASEGASVVVNDYGGDSAGNRGDSGPAEKVVAEIRAAGGDAVADAHDVADEGAAIVETAMATFGCLHAVINNAGIANGGDFDTIPMTDFTRLMDVHLGGTLAVCRAAWPIFRKQGYGRIVNTSSVSMFGIPNSPAYVTAKSAIFGLTRAIAAEGKSLNIKANSVMPSAYTRLTAMAEQFKDIMEVGFPPARVSPFVGALASRNVEVSGETFIVGGGRVARVVLGTVPGATQVNSIDDALARFSEIMDSTQIAVPADTLEEVIDECTRIGIDPSIFTSY